jgi:multidrug efflux pump subunit AcrA (membrane-fusion protein)
MVIDSTQAARRGPDEGPVSIAEVLDRLSRFDGPPEMFLQHLLAVQCYLTGASGGVILRAARAPGDDQGGATERVEVIAVYPRVGKGQAAPAWVAHAAESAPRALAEGKTAAVPLRGAQDLYDQPAASHMILVPVRGARGVRGVAAFVLQTRDAAAVAAATERVELTVSLLGLYEMRLSLQRRQMDLQRLRLAMDSLAAVNEHDRFAGAAMALCNEIATRWGCERVSLGFLHGRYVKLRAMSHTEKFSRKMQVVQDLEAAMEECLDQDLEVLHPSGPEATFVHRAAGQLARRDGAGSVLSVPIRRRGEVFAVLTLERASEEAFPAEQVESLRLTCELLSTRLASLYEHGRWFGVRWAAAARRALGAVVGPKHTWAKVAALAGLGAVLFLLFAKGEHRADASFALDAETVRIVPAPFEAYLDRVLVKPGEQVRRGQVLARMATEQLLDQLDEYRQQFREAEKKRSVAMDQREWAQAQIAEAQRDSAEAAIRQIQRRIAEATVRAPIAGTVLQGDWQREEGRAIKTGEALFEVSPLVSLWAELAVPEDEIADVALRLRQARRTVTLSVPDAAVAAVREALAAGDRPAGTLTPADGPTLSFRLVGLDEPAEGSPAVPTARVLLDEPNAAIPPGRQGRGNVALAGRRFEATWRCAGLEGELAAEGYPDRRIRFVVERINPVAEVQDQQNVFKVRARLLNVDLQSRHRWLSPGMTGTAKIALGRASYGWLWTRPIVNWLRMKLWL